MAKSISSKSKEKEQAAPVIPTAEPMTEPVLEIEEEQPLVAEPPKPEPKVEEVKVVAPPPPPAVSEKLSFEEKILNFVDSRTGGNTKLNDFIKSLYPRPTIGNPPEYLNQGESKRLRSILSGMIANQQIIIRDNAHLLLGKFYHEPVDQKTCHRNINDVDLFVEK